MDDRPLPRSVDPDPPTFTLHVVDPGGDNRFWVASSDRARQVEPGDLIDLGVISPAESVKYARLMAADRLGVKARDIKIAAYLEDL